MSATLAMTRCLENMRRLVGVCCFLLCAISAWAQPVVSLRIPDETEPPGGLLEMKVQLTEPEPILTGGIALEFEPAPLGSLEDAALFSPAGDVTGAAVVVGGSRVYIAFNSPDGSFGTGGRDQAIAALAIPVRSDAAVGSQARLTLDPNASWWINPQGDFYVQEVRQGLLTVGGRLSINNVVPGSALVPAGASIAVLGTGFQPGARVQIEGVAVSSTRFVSPTRLEARLGQDTQMHGKRIRVRNANGTEVTYYSFQRTVSFGDSSRPLLARTVPIFALATYFEAYFSAFADPGRFSAVAFKTAGDEPADISLEAYSAEGELLGSTTLTLPQGRRIAREASELFPEVTFGPGSRLRAVSSIAVQMLGLLGDDAAGTVVPVDPDVVP